MDSQYGKLYRDLYQKHWWWRAREEALVHFLRSELSSKPKRKILDIGCGDGLFFDRLAEFGEVAGVEPDDRLITKDGPHASRIRVAPFDKTFHSESRYGLIVMLDVLEHLEDPAGALALAHSLLAADGKLLMTVPAFQSLWTNHDVINHHRLRYKRSTLFPLLHAAGFEVTHSRYWFQWTVPAKFIIGVAQKIAPSEPAMPKIPPFWVNRLLYGFSRLEQKTIGSTEISVGSTLMVYCTRN